MMVPEFTAARKAARQTRLAALRLVAELLFTITLTFAAFGWYAVLNPPDCPGEDCERVRIVGQAEGR